MTIHLCKKIPSPKVIGRLVPEMRILAWQPSWSCDQDHLNKLSFPYPKEHPYEIYSLSGLVVSEEKMIEKVDGRRMANAGVIGIPLAQVS